MICFNCVYFERTINACKIHKTEPNGCSDFMYYKYLNNDERKLVLSLPCCVGDTLYSINKGSTNPIIEMSVTAILITSKYENWKIYTKDKIDYGECCYLPCNIGKTVFLSKEQAEEKLKIMENESHI